MLSSILFPDTCIFCGDTCNRHTLIYVCNSCYSGLPFRSSWYRHSVTEVHCFRYSAYLVSPFSYTDSISEAINRMKFSDGRYISRMFGNAIANMLKYQHSTDAFDIIVPVPLHHERYKSRGYNQAYDIAREISRELNKPLYDILIKTRATVSQHTLNRVDREESKDNLYMVADNRLLAGKSVLLVDDVATTGATLEACGKCLSESGAANIIYSAAATGRQ